MEQIETLQKSETRLREGLRELAKEIREFIDSGGILADKTKCFIAPYERLALLEDAMDRALLSLEGDKRA